MQERMKTVHQQKAAERRASQTENEEQKRQWVCRTVIIIFAKVLYFIIFVNSWAHEKKS